MSLNPTEKELVNQNTSKEKNVVSKTMQNSQFLPNTQTFTYRNQNQYSFVIEEKYGFQIKDLSDVLSYIAETISKDELKILISHLKQKQLKPLRTLERKQKMYQLPTRKEFFSKYPTAAIRQQLIQQIQEDPYANMNILGDSVLEYNLAQIPYMFAHNKLMEPQHKKEETLTSNQKMEENIYGTTSILNNSIGKYDIVEVPDEANNISQKPTDKKREVLTPEQKVEREQLRQLQLQEQEALYDRMDLLGEAILKFSPLQQNTPSLTSIEHEESLAHSIISVPSDTPQTSFAPRRISKYLSPEQIAQLEKIRKKRFEQQQRGYSQGELLGESVPNALKDKYSFRQPNARLQSPRELVFKKSIVNVKKNKNRHSKGLALPVINFPPTNWPTPKIPEVRLDLDKLRHEQRQYFLSMQQARVLQRSQNPNQNEDHRQSIIQGQNLKSSQSQQENIRQNQNKLSRNLIYSDDEGNVYSKEDRHILMKYLYIILFVQWSIITGIVSVFKYYKPSSLWLKSSGEWTWLYILCTLNLVVISFIIFPTTRNIYPINLIMLTIFMLLVAFMLSFVEIYYPNDSVLLALGCTCGICLVFALYFCQTRYNFTIYGGLSLCSIIILMILGIFYLLTDVIVLQIVYAAISVSLYSIYLVCNTRAIVREKSKFHIESDNYILGAIHLNLDFIFIIIEKIQCT